MTFSVNNKTWTTLIRQFRNLLIHFMTNWHSYTILFPMVYRICMFCFFMDSIFPTYAFLDTCSNPWSAIFLYRYKSVRNSMEKYCITRNKCNNLIRMAKNDYFSTISEKNIAESSGSKNWWNLVNKQSLPVNICKLLSIRVKITLVVKKYFPFIRCRWFTRMV
jgi:hypothetical protein